MNTLYAYQDFDKTHSIISRVRLALTCPMFKAAPELLAACKALVELVREGGDAFVPEIIQGEAAIAKAEERHH